MFNDVFDFLLPIIHFDEPNILDYSTFNHTKKEFKKQKINLLCVKGTWFSTPIININILITTLYVNNEHSHQHQKNI